MLVCNRQYSISICLLIKAIYKLFSVAKQIVFSFNLINSLTLQQAYLKVNSIVLTKFIRLLFGLLHKMNTRE